MRPPAVDAHRDAEVDRFIDELLSAESAAELLVGVHQVLGRAIATTYRHHIDDTDQVTDVPTIRCLRRILIDYEPMLAWADEAVDAYIAGGVEEAKLSTWRWHITRLLASIGGVTGADARGEAPTPLRIDAKPYERGTVPNRDSRFDTFIHTGDYDTADAASRFDKHSYEAIRLRFIRTQRDEVDAIEAFGTFIWDIRFKDFNAEYDLARITWDEARHTEIGHRAMLHGCTIGAGTLIGMGATILNNARIGKNCLVGANALVTEGKEFPDGSLIVGSPAKVVRPLDEAGVARLSKSTDGYVRNWKRFAKGLQRID
jgi:hypothetical protein